MATIPDKPALEGLEQKWDAAWNERGTYVFDRIRAAEAGRQGWGERDVKDLHLSGCGDDGEASGGLAAHADLGEGRPDAFARGAEGVLVLHQAREGAHGFQ